MKKLRILSYISIILILIFLCSITYVYYNINDKEEKEIIKNNLTITYKDTSNLSMVNALIGEKITKEFTIKNNTNNNIYYNITLEDVANNYENNNNLVYRIVSNNKVYVKDKSFPDTNENIVSDILINIGEEHTYKIEVEFIKKDYDQSNDLKKTFSSTIKVNEIQKDNIYKDNTLIKMISDSSLGSEEDISKLNTDGVYKTNSSINGKTIYFYNGSKNLNNNVVLGSICYKILRTTIDDGVRLIYSGKYKDGKCIETKDEISQYSFNSLSDNNAYVGYMYGNASSSNYESEHSNINSSDIKILLDSWYSTNVSLYENYLLKSTIYCNERTTSSFIKNGISYGILGYEKQNTGYTFMNMYLNDKQNISYDCNNLNDRFSQSDEYGNGKLINSIGLISANELYYSGYTENDNFLSTDYEFWTMTPAYFSGKGAYNVIANNGKIDVCLVSSKKYIRPVITIKPSVIITSGNGSNDTPYLIELKGEE